MPSKTYICPQCGTPVVSNWTNGCKEPKTIMCPRGHVVTTGTFSQVVGIVSGVMKIFGK